jgi:putative flippase GtrA
MARRIRRLAANVVWVVVGVGLFAICIDVFGGYPSWHSEALDWIAVVVIMVLAAVVWYWYDRDTDSA